MREIKFRAWDKNSMMFFDLMWGNSGRGQGWIGMLPLGEELQRGLYDNRIQVDPYDCDIMQYTGLKDKNGTEIYEGDILQRNDNSITVVEFENGMFTTAYDSLKFELYDNGSVVIGNIYQNPELLE